MRQEDLDVLRAMPVAAPAMIINGKPVMAKTGATLNVVSPIDGSLLTKIPDASEADVNVAITSERRSFDSGVCHALHPCCEKIMLAWADLIDKHAIVLQCLVFVTMVPKFRMALKAEPISVQYDPLLCRGN